ncbi:hypothetical protein FD29_GL001919 [Companilactobacillus mindensis DSM 14500]|uniref:Uncharacterized protein n=1 Tax=Companilactobacillus mindensis DSM 14500 TaxID=1423770 RepID=A0A0R1QMY9_9LACO|nr:hypothetical protein FD29_GL001919 [Companilactobacillus mindensis DSM 14500]GEO77779.1 hypothetical protein LMI01_01100 [Companilactobacillus mindensis]
MEGISTNPFEHPNTAKAIANGEIQQHQRALERKVRHDKKMIHYSEKMKDVVGQSHYKDMLSRHRSQLRDVVKNYDFLHRDYSREKIATGLSKKESNRITQKRIDQEAKLNSLKKEFGKAGFPKDMDEYRRVIYNRSDTRALRAHTSGREKGIVEPVIRYTDFIAKSNELNTKLIGLKTKDGRTVESYSQHMIARTFDTKNDESHGNVVRIGNSPDELVNDLKNGTVIEPDKEKLKTCLLKNGKNMMELNMSVQSHM